MRPLTRMLLFAALLVLPRPSLLAQTAVDPSGHWQGTIQTPGTAVDFEVDLAKSGNGELAGTLSIPAQRIKGLPLDKVAVKGTSVNFQVRADQPFSGVLSADGISMAGDLFVNAATFAFSMTRVGEARVEAPAKSAPITKELGGTWNGTLEVAGMQVRLELTMSNQPDGTATGRIVNLDEGGLQVPVVITQQSLSRDAGFHRRCVFLCGHAERIRYGAGRRVYPGSIGRSADLPPRCGIGEQK